MNKDYTVIISGFITIHPSIKYKVNASNEYEAKLEAAALFDEDMEREYGWADYDELFYEAVEEIGENE